jgi:tRNA(fMet)-specific endonuclease VapC
MYCLDSNIIIFFLKHQNLELNQKISDALFAEEINTTSICASELLYYSYKNKATKTLELRQEFLSQLNILSFDYKAAQIFAQIKTELEIIGQKVDDIDLQIASICLAQDRILVTNNTKHFQNIKNLKLQDWSK